MVAFVYGWLSFVCRFFFPSTIINYDQWFLRSSQKDSFCFWYACKYGFVLLQGCIRTLCKSTFCCLLQKISFFWPKACQEIHKEATGHCHKSVSFVWEFIPVFVCLLVLSYFYQVNDNKFCVKDKAQTKFQFCLPFCRVLFLEKTFSFFFLL